MIAILMNILTFAVGLMIIFLTGCGSVQPGVPQAYIYGDSITAGVGLPKSWAVLGANQMGFSNPTNKSIPGTNISYPNQYPTIMVDSARWAQGSIIIYSPGQNDCMGGEAHALEFKKDLHNIIQTVINRGNVKLYLGTPYRNVSELSGALNANIDEYAQITRDLVTESNSSNIVLIDFNKYYQPTIQTNPENDLVHPGPLGTEEMLNLFLQTTEGK